MPCPVAVALPVSVLRGCSVYGPDWSCKAPIKLVHVTYAKSKHQQHEEVVVLSKVLAADINLGYQDIGNIQVLAVNGTKVRPANSC